MRILRIQVDGLPLYKEKFDVSFLATQRVDKKHLNCLHHLFGNIYVNTIEAFIGINASGKTIALKIVTFTCMLLSSTHLSGDYVPDILEDNQETTFDVDFYIDDKLYHLKSKLIGHRNERNKVDIKIIEETLWSKMANSTVNKVNIFDFDNLEPIRIRDHTAEYLSDDVSIMIAVNRQTNNHTSFIDLSGITNINILIPFLGTVPTEIINLLDNTIEKISVETINDNPVTKLKFLNRDELLLSNPNELNYYLSSGTIRGIRFFTDAIRILKEGGYLTIDEIENHFNRELVASLLRLFIDKRTNPKGSVIIFSTHYAEILDEIVRNDAIFITRNDFGLTIDNLSTLLNRNDMKKSEVYQSNYVGGTAPKYSALNALQKSIINYLGDN